MNFDLISLIFIGAIFVGFPIWIYCKYVSTNKAIKNGRKVNAIVQSCTKMKEEEDGPTYYKVVYQYIDKYGGTRTYTADDERSKTVGKSYRMHVLYEDDEKNTVLFSEKDAKDNLKNQKLVRIVLFGFAGIVFVIMLFAFFSQIYPEFEQFVGNYIFAPGVSILFVFIGIRMFASAIRKRKMASSEFVRKIEARITGYRKRHSNSDTGSRYSYYPIYEFNQNGTVEIFESNYGSNRKRPVGSTATLLQDMKTGEIFEKKSIKTDLIFALAFGGLGLVALVALIIGYIQV